MRARAVTGPAQRGRGGNPVKRGTPAPPRRSGRARPSGRARRPPATRRADGVRCARRPPRPRTARCRRAARRRRALGTRTSGKAGQPRASSWNCHPSRRRRPEAKWSTSRPARAPGLAVRRGEPPLPALEEPERRRHQHEPLDGRIARRGHRGEVAAERAADDRVRRRRGGEEPLRDRQHRGRGGALEAVGPGREVRDLDRDAEGRRSARRGRGPSSSWGRRRSRGGRGAPRELNRSGPRPRPRREPPRRHFPAFSLSARQRSPSAFSRPLSESFTTPSPRSASGRYSSAT